MSDDEDMDDSEASAETPSAGNATTAQRIAELMVRAYQSSNNSANNPGPIITQGMNFLLVCKL